jgi:SHS2 domain-containing protein
MDVQGFRELDHAADWELEVWAPTFKGLLEQAVLGMNELSGIQTESGTEVIKDLSIQAVDLEMLLINFLTEILFLGEVENLGFNKFVLSKRKLNIEGQIYGYYISSIEKQIKAVTFHNLSIEYKEGKYFTRIIFDV